jgi:tRNA dimethylallyltransferase
MRALEVIRGTGKPFSGFHGKKKSSLPFSVVKIGLELERKTLYDRIDDRMDDMLQKGLFAEAERFFAKRHLNALQTVGYREIFGFLEGTYDKEEAIRLLKRNSRHYAKRQLTWFKRDSEIEWFDPEDWERIVGMVTKKIK